MLFRSGKTPHSEYLIDLLQHRWRVVLLSRGYRRKSKGFILANEDSTAELIGDEPYQIMRKFPKISVAVDAKRVHGIECLQQQALPPEVVLLDDAYQHRQVTPGLSLLLIDYNRLAHKDHMMPLGRLREPVANSDRADIIIITKCPKSIKPVDMMTIRKEVNPYPFQKLYFSSYSYGKTKAVFPELANEVHLELSSSHVLALSAIANGEPFYKYLQKHAMDVDVMSFGDHHFFDSEDYKNIAKRFEEIIGTQKMIVVTEKDEARLLNDPLLPDSIKSYLYSLPIQVKFLNNSGKEFDSQILGYVKRIMEK